MDALGDVIDPSEELVAREVERRRPATRGGARIALLEYLCLPRVELGVTVARRIQHEGAVGAQPPFAARLGDRPTLARAYARHEDVLTQADPFGVALAVHGQQLRRDPDEVPAAIEELSRPAIGIDLRGKLTQPLVGSLRDLRRLGHRRDPMPTLALAAAGALPRGVRAGRPGTRSAPRSRSNPSRGSRLRWGSPGLVRAADDRHTGESRARFSRPRPS